MDPALVTTILNDQGSKSPSLVVTRATRSFRRAFRELREFSEKEVEREVVPMIKSTYWDKPNESTLKKPYWHNQMLGDLRASAYPSFCFVDFNIQRLPNCCGRTK